MRTHRKREKKTANVNKPVVENFKKNSYKTSKVGLVGPSHGGPNLNLLYPTL